MPVFLGNDRKHYDNINVEHLKSREKTWLCLVFPQHFSHVLLHYSVFYYCPETNLHLIFIPFVLELVLTTAAPAFSKIRYFAYTRRLSP